tara:strand:- start:52 stop:276 length:225 start_codon:yes stop_codon:yes gene_type:complete
MHYERKIKHGRFQLTTSLVLTTCTDPLLLTVIISVDAPPDPVESLETASAACEAIRYASSRDMDLALSAIDRST